MEEFLKTANSAPMYLAAGITILFVLLQSILFLIKAYRHGIAIGMDRALLKKVALSSAAFSFVPSIGILIGVLALAPSLGVPVPWLRLSVIGALHYEGATANNLAKGMGIGELPSSRMNGGALASITLGMTIGMLFGCFFILLFFRRYQKKIAAKAGGNPKLGNLLFSSMFIGMIAAYLGDAVSYLFEVKVSGVTRTPNILPLVAFLTALVSMGFFQHLIQKRHVKWLENYALSFAMLIGMACAVIGKMLFPSLGQFVV